MLVLEYGVHHVDLNFGCPVRKITARGGGSALPLRPQLFARWVTVCVRVCGRRRVVRVWVLWVLPAWGNVGPTYVNPGPYYPRNPRRPYAVRPSVRYRLVAAAVAGAGGSVPVTVKMRVGLTADMATHIQVSPGGWGGQRGWRGVLQSASTNKMIHRDIRK